MAKLAKRSEMVEIFGESKVGEYTVKPWTISQFVKLSPMLKQVTTALKEEGIDISQADLQNINLDMNVTVSDIVKYLTMGIDIAGPVIPQLIAVSVRIDLEKAEELEWGEALALAAKIIIFNWDHIKNWLGQITGKDPGALFLADKTNSSSQK